jgi:hypothetical protein
MMENVCGTCGAIVVKAIEEGKLEGWQIVAVTLGLGAIGLLGCAVILNYNYKLQSLGIGAQAMRLSGTKIRGIK